jgi:hypothetical protein
MSMDGKVDTGIRQEKYQSAAVSFKKLTFEILMSPFSLFSHFGIIIIFASNMFVSA